MLVVSGYVYKDGKFFEGTVYIDEGIIKGVTRGINRDASIKGVIIPKPHNAHVHLLDYIAKDATEERDLIRLVAPPNGVKHRVLREASDDMLKNALSIARALAEKYHLGLVTEFRELGKRGASLGRPSEIFRVLSRPKNPDEARILIKISDGFNISSISDVGYETAEEISRIARSHRKMLGIHVSERIREDIDAVLDLNPTFLVHAVEATRDDLVKISSEGIPVVICPRSNAYFGLFPKVDEMIRVGIRVLLGTDNHMINSMNVFEEAEFLYKISRVIGQKIRALDIIRMLFRDFTHDFNVEDGVTADKIIVIGDLRGKPELIVLNRHSSAPIYDLSSPRVAMRSA